jgi:hypothetical protein
MLRFASDADANGKILRGLEARLPGLTIIRAVDELPEGTPDPEVLAWAAAADRILITNDRQTMVGFARRRAAAGEPMPGLIVMNNDQPAGAAIDDLELLAVCMPPEEVRARVVVFLPFRA